MADNVKAPWHFWAIGGAALLWNGFGAYDYVMTKTRGDAYMRAAGMTDAQIAHLGAMPAWMTAVWAIGVWGAVLGTLLLLLRNKLAVPVFVASLAAFVASLVYGYMIAPIPDASAMLAVMQAVIFAGCVFFVWYAMRASRLGILR